MKAALRMLVAVVLVGTLAACGSPQKDTPQPPAGPSLLISDQAHHDGTHGFFFLFPMVPPVPHGGTFQGGLKPVVTIEELPPGTRGLIATYTTTSGPYAGKVFELGESYNVLWPTAPFNLNPAYMYRIRVSVGGLELGLADVDVVKRIKELLTVDTGEYVPMLDDFILPIRFRIEPEALGCLGVVCLALDQCHVAGVCDPRTGACTNPLKPDGAACTDGNACTQTDTCRAGVCLGSNLVTCGLGDQCHDVGACDPATGACVNPPKPNGTTCNDGNLCTEVDTCQAGVCTGGGPVTCAASDQCHDAGTCDPVVGLCSNPEKPAGTACNDGNACTLVDDCLAGACTGSTLVTCLAADQCHAPGICDTATGICSTPHAADGTWCSDGNACTQADSCVAGLCAGLPVVCAAPDECHVGGTCSAETGACGSLAAPDGTACTAGTCIGGSCTALYRIGGALVGLTGSGLVLTTPGEPNLTLNSGASSFWFATHVPPGTRYSVTVSVQPEGPEQHCSVANGEGIVGVADVANIEVTCVVPATGEQIIAVRAAALSATTSPVSLDLPVQGAIVTYTKGSVGGAPVGSADGPGFFVQAGDEGSAGPAIYVAIDPPTAGGGVAVGDRVDLVVTAAARLGCVAGCTAPNTGMAAVTGASVVIRSHGSPLPKVMEMSTSAAAVWPLPIANPWDLEHQRVSLTGTINSISRVGAGFWKGQVLTAGVAAATTNLQIRVPDALSNQFAVVTGLRFKLLGTPAFRTDNEVDLSVWDAADLQTSPSILGTVPPDGSVNVSTAIAMASVVFNQPMDPASFIVQGSPGACTGTLQFSSDSFTTCVGWGGAAPVMSANNTIATIVLADPLTAHARYKFRALSTAATASGWRVQDGTANVTSVNGFLTAPAGSAACTASQVVISQVYGGGGNTGAYWMNDFIELHNRGSAPIDIGGWSVQYVSAAGSFAANNTGVTTIPTATVIPAGGFYLIEEGPGAGGIDSLTSDRPGGMIAMGATGGKVLLANVSGAIAAGSCPVAGTTANVMDFVAYGSTNATTGCPSVTAPVASNTTSVARAADGCADTRNAGFDFVISSDIVPRNMLATPVACSCSGYDITPPGVVVLSATDVTADSITLTWLAPASDGNVGGAVLAYDLRATSGSACPLTEANFYSAVAVPTQPPKAPGMPERVLVNGFLAPGTVYCFALSAADAAGNVSTGPSLTVNF